MTITSIKIANAMVEQLRAELAAAQAVIEQKNEALKVITRRANCLDVLEIARTANEALTLQPCTEVLNKVRADAVREAAAMLGGEGEQELLQKIVPMFERGEV